MEFQDDGGTPMWRARQQHRVFEAHPRRAAWQRLPLSAKLLTLAFIFLVAPWLFLIAGIAVLVVLNQLGLNPG